MTLTQLPGFDTEIVYYRRSFPRGRGGGSPGENLSPDAGRISEQKYAQRNVVTHDGIIDARMLGRPTWGEPLLAKNPKHSR